MNPHRGETQIKLADESYQVKLTLDGIARIEKAVGQSIIKIATRLSEGDLKTNEVSEILTIAIRSGGNNVNNVDINKLIWQAGLVESIRLCGEILSIALSSGDDEGKE